MLPAGSNSQLSSCKPASWQPGLAAATASLPCFREDEEYLSTRGKAGLCRDAAIFMMDVRFYVGIGSWSV